MITNEKIKDFPFLSILGTDENGNYITVLDELPQGWKDSFVEQLCMELKEELIKEKKLNEYCVIQAKEKNGELRWYANIENRKLRLIINKYKLISRNICVLCSKDVDLRGKIESNILLPICEKCYNKIKK